MYASNAANLSLVHPIRSYQTRSAQTPPCTILEAACACVASPETFLPVTIGAGHKKVVLVDALSVCPNPGNELLREAQQIFGDDAEVATMLSIGAGKGDVWSMSETDGTSMRDAVKRAVANCEPVHEELYARLRESAIYFRLNVDKSSGQQMTLSSSHISAYLREGAINDKLDDAIRSIERRPKGVKLKDISELHFIYYRLRRSSLCRLRRNHRNRAQATTFAGSELYWSPGYIGRDAPHTHYQSFCGSHDTCDYGSLGFGRLR